MCGETCNDDDLVSLLGDLGRCRGCVKVASCRGDHREPSRVWRWGEATGIGLLKEDLELGDRSEGVNRS